jgi:hypothetical protein
LLQHGQTGRQTVVENLSTFDSKEFAIINPIPMQQPNLKFYQMGEEGNLPDAYELHTTRHMKRLVFRDFTISNKYPNNIVLVKNLGVCVVHDMRLDRQSDSFRVLLSPFVKQEDFFQGKPCNSSEFWIFMVSGGIDATKRTTVNAKDILNQFVCLLYEKVVDVNAAAQVQSSAANSANLDKKKTVWVCIPLMHALFQ